MNDPYSSTHAPEDEPTPAKQRYWGSKFGYALRGWKYGIRGQASFSVHFFFAALVLVAAAVLRCSLEQWCLLLLCIGGVLATELVNSAFETLFRALDPQTRDNSWKALDIAAGAVLLMSITAAIVGLLVFGQRLMEMYGPR
jgi:diacylglycerol kinase